MAEIKKSEISEKGLLDGFVKDANKGIKAIDEFNKGLEETLKLQAEFVKQSKKDTTSKGLKKQAENFKKVDTTVKQLNDTRKVSLQLAKERDKAELKLKKLSTDRIQQTVQLNRLSKEQNAINKDTEILNNKKVGTLVKLAATNRKLQREINGIVITGKKEEDQIARLNKKINENNKIIDKNSSKVKKQKNNVGGYTDGIKEAASASGLFGGILGKLNAVQETLNALTKKNVVAEEADVVAKTAQAGATANLTVAQKGLTLATGGGVKALKAFKIALASSGIGAILLGLGALIAFFKRSQDGVDSLSTGFAGLTTALDVVIDRFALAGEGLKDVIAGFFSFDFDQVSAGLDKIGGAFKGIGDELAIEVRLATQLKRLTIELTREHKLFEAQQAAEITKAKELNLISRDKLKSDQVRLKALKDANKIEIAISERQLELQEQALAASLDSISADKTSLELGAEQLEFIQAIKEGRIDAASAVKQAADFTLSSAAGEEALFEIIEKIVAQEQAKQALLDKQATTIKKTSALQVQIATKNAMALVREAQALRQIAKDQDETIERRIDLLTEAAAKEIESFRIQKDANIKNEQELAAAKLQINAKLQADIKKLFGKGEDFEAIARKQVKVVNDIEQELLDQQISALQRRLEVEELSVDERIKLINEIGEIEKTKAQAQSEFLISLEGKTAEEIELIRLKLAGKLDDIRNAEVDAVKQANEKILQSETDLQADREALQDARIQSAKNVTEILKLIAGEDEESQKNIQRLQKTLAVAEILINLNREISGIREKNAKKEDSKRLNTSQIFQANTAAALGIAGVLATGFEKGGLVEGKEQLININEKGEEFVVDAQTTKTLGLNKKGSNMQDFHQRMDNGLLMSPHAFKSLEVGSVVKPSDVGFKQVIKNQNDVGSMLARTIEKNATSFELKGNDIGELVSTSRKGSHTKVRTFRKSRIV